MHAAVTRRQHGGIPGPDGWYPEQRISLEQALHGYTTGAAYAAGLEYQQGRLWTGCFADLIVLEQDPFAVLPDDLFKIKNTRTMVGGKWVWEVEN
jgi:predicted amidohydrolase YtcJ